MGFSPRGEGVGVLLTPGVECGISRMSSRSEWMCGTRSLESGEQVRRGGDRLPQQLQRLKLETGRRSPQRQPPPGPLGVALGAGARGAVRG